jgi:hypothetical protein
MDLKMNLVLVPVMDIRVARYGAPGLVVAGTKARTVVTKM